MPPTFDAYGNYMHYPPAAGPYMPHDYGYVDPSMMPHHGPYHHPHDYMPHDYHYGQHFNMEVPAQEYGDHKAYEPEQPSYEPYHYPSAEPHMPHHDYNGGYEHDLLFEHHDDEIHYYYPSNE